MNRLKKWTVSKDQWGKWSAYSPGITINRWPFDSWVRAYRFARYMAWTDPEGRER